MRRIGFWLILAVGLLAHGERGAGQSGSGGVFWAPNTARQVTISLHGTTIATLTFPTGTFLDITVAGNVEPVTNPGEWTFAGDLSVRAQPAATAPGQTPGRSAAQIMSQAPFVLTMKDAEMLVENLKP
jgi:hypothetical protein